VTTQKTLLTYALWIPVRFSCDHNYPWWSFTDLS